MRSNRKGFTLIELMIVVVLVGILAAIAIPNFVAMQDRAKEATMASNMKSVQLAIEDLAVQYDGKYLLNADSIRTRLPSTVKNPWKGGRDTFVYRDTVTINVPSKGTVIMTPRHYLDFGSKPSVGYQIYTVRHDGTIGNTVLNDGNPGPEVDQHDIF